MPDTTTRTDVRDPRTADQKRVDEMVANGDWSEFESFEVLLSDEASRAVLDARKRFGLFGEPDQPADALARVPDVTELPFLWDKRAFRIRKAVVAAGRATVIVEPADPGFEAEVRRRIETDRLHRLNYYHGCGFACFPEDYVKYQG